MEWVLTHPWLTFWLGFFGLVVIDSVVANICNTIIYIYNSKKEGDLKDED